MENATLNGLARRITILGPTSQQALEPTVIYEKKRKRKKGSRALKGLEKIVRRRAKARVTFSQTYLERHERSNAKKKDGWVRDRGYNIIRASRKAFKVLKKK